jgi:Methyltransferase FkbM domain
LPSCFGNGTDLRIADAISREGTGGAGSRTIPIYSLDERIAALGLPPPDFIKIDTEGAEYDILCGAMECLERWHPALYLEMHGADLDQKLANAEKIVRLLERLGYRGLRHIESSLAIDSSNFASAASGHIYAESQTE